MANLSFFDSIIIFLYFLLVLAVAFYFSRRRDENTRDYFLAGRGVGWFAIGASLFATNISSEHFIGLAGSGASHGLAVGSFEWMAVFWLILLGWVFAPLFLKAGIYTVPQFLEKRFGTPVKMYLASISIIAYILTKISVTLFAGGMVLRYVLGWDIYTSSLVMVLLTGIYTIVGGLSAVIYSSVLQTFFLIGGTLLVTILGLQEVGGFSALRASLPADYFSMFKPAADPNFPWTGILFGAPILGVWYWCTDQYIVQRVLGAKNVEAARTGTIFAGFLKLLPVFLLVLPGLIAVALFPGTTGDTAFPTLLASSILPAGVKGLVIAALLAAMMSSLASFFHSTATLFTMDFYRHFNPKASERKLVLVGRLATTGIVVSALLWVPLTKLISSNLYIYLQSVQAYIAPPITALFLIGIFWKRINGNGALCSLIGGGLLGAFRLILEISKNTGLGVPSPLEWVVGMNFLHFAILLFLVSVGILVVGSVLSPANRYTAILTWPGDFSLRAAGVEFGSRMISTNRLSMALSILLIFLVVGFWSLFV
ncbi:MAG: sodium:solute symporter [Calditrichia bacterium]